MERVGQVLRLTSCQPGFVSAGKNGQQLEAIAGSPDGEGISSLHGLETGRNLPMREETLVILSPGQPSYRKSERPLRIRPVR